MCMAPSAVCILIPLPSNLWTVAMILRPSIDMSSTFAAGRFITLLVGVLTVPIGLGASFTADSSCEKLLSVAAITVSMQSRIMLNTGRLIVKRRLILSNIFMMFIFLLIENNDGRKLFFWLDGALFNV